VGAGWALVDACGEMDVDSPGLLAGLLGHTSTTTGTATAADAAAISAILAGLVRYHGGGGALNVKALLFEARSRPLTVQVLTVVEASRRVGGGGAGSTSRGATYGSSRTLFAG
jgi:hypothetical protein